MKKKHLWLAAIIAITPLFGACNEAPDGGDGDNGGNETPVNPDDPDNPPLPDNNFPKTIIGAIEVKDYKGDKVTETSRMSFTYNDNGLLREMKVTGSENASCNIRYNNGLVEYDYFEEGKQTYYCSLTLQNGLGVRGTILDHTEKESEKESLTYGYDESKHLIQTAVKEDKEPSVITDLKWRADNLSSCTWLDGDILREDEFRYSPLSLYNKFNLDLNWLLIDTDGCDAAAGDPMRIFPMCRMTGKSSILLVETARYYDDDTDSYKDMRFEYKNLNGEILVIMRYNGDNVLDREYTVTFLE